MSKRILKDPNPIFPPCSTRREPRSWKTLQVCAMILAIGGSSGVAQAQIDIGKEARPSQGDRPRGQRGRIVPDPTIGQLFPRAIFRGAFTARVDEAQ